MHRARTPAPLDSQDLHPQLGSRRNARPPPAPAPTLNSAAPSLSVELQKALRRDSIRTQAWRCAYSSMTLCLYFYSCSAINLALKTNLRPNMFRAHLARNYRDHVITAGSKAIIARKRDLYDGVPPKRSASGAKGLDMAAQRRRFTPRRYQTTARSTASSESGIEMQSVQERGNNVAVTRI